MKRVIYHAYCYERPFHKSRLIGVIAVAIVDEAHKLKSRRSKTLGSIAQLISERLIELSGTPRLNKSLNLPGLLFFFWKAWWMKCEDDDPSISLKRLEISHYQFALAHRSKISWESAVGRLGLPSVFSFVRLRCVVIYWHCAWYSISNYRSFWAPNVRSMRLITKHAVCITKPAVRPLWPLIGPVLHLSIARLTSREPGL